MISIFDVARYIAETSSGEFVFIGKINCLCYFSQAYYMAIYHKPLFHEDFYALCGCAVCRDLTDYFKGKHNVRFSDIPGDSGKLSELQKKCINATVADYKDFDTAGLSGIIKQGDAYKKAIETKCSLENDLKAAVTGHPVEIEPIIQKSDMFDTYFSALLDTANFSRIYFTNDTASYNLAYHIVIVPEDKTIPVAELRDAFKNVGEKLEETDKKWFISVRFVFVENTCVHVFISATPEISVKQIVDKIIAKVHENRPDLVFSDRFLSTSIGSTNGNVILGFLGIEMS